MFFSFIRYTITMTSYRCGNNEIQFREYENTPFDNIEIGVNLRLQFLHLFQKRILGTSRNLDKKWNKVPIRSVC